MGAVPGYCQATEKEGEEGEPDGQSAGADESEAGETAPPAEDSADSWGVDEDDWGGSSFSTSGGDFDLEWGGAVQTDIRFQLNELRQGEGEHARVFPEGLERNENRFKLKLKAPSERFTAVVDVDFVWTQRLTQLQAFSDLSLRERTDPFRLEAHAVYLEARDLVLEGLDLRLGQQKVMWGVGDQFNPLNNLNSEDLEDPLLFGDQQSNLMARLDYAPFMGSDSVLLDTLTMTAVVVPMFKPALLPASGELGLAAVDRLPHLDDDERWFAGVAQVAGGKFGNPTVVTDIKTQLPESSVENMQMGFQIATNILEQDLSLSYYRGRTDMPVPVTNHTEQVKLLDDEGQPLPACDLTSLEPCTTGALETTVTLGYPELQVVGMNLAGELDLLGWISSAVQPLGYRLEAGLFFPEETRLDVTHGPFDFSAAYKVAPEDPVYLGPELPLVLDDQPFMKWVLGLDYSFGQHVYANVQWVHGMVDELGAGDFLFEGKVARRVGTEPLD